MKLPLFELPKAESYAETALITWLTNERPKITTERIEKSNLLPQHIK